MTFYFRFTVGMYLFILKVFVCLVVVKIL